MSFISEEESEEDFDRREDRREEKEREAIARLLRMAEARDNETTGTMQEYTQRTHHLKIEEEGYGYLGVSIRPLGTERPEYFVLVPKHRHGTGTTYLYRDASRLSELAVEPYQLMPGTAGLKGKTIPEWLAMRESLGISPPEGQTPDQRKQAQRKRAQRKRP